MNGKKTHTHTHTHTPTFYFCSISSNLSFEHCEFIPPLKNVFCHYVNFIGCTQKKHSLYTVPRTGIASYLTAFDSLLFCDFSPVTVVSLLPFPCLSLWSAMPSCYIGALNFFFLITLNMRVRRFQVYCLLSHHVRFHGGWSSERTVGKRCAY